MHVIVQTQDCVAWRAIEDGHPISPVAIGLLQISAHVSSKSCTISGWSFSPKEWTTAPTHLIDASTQSCCSDLSSMLSPVFVPAVSWLGCSPARLNLLMHLKRAVATLLSSRLKICSTKNAIQTASNIDRLSCSLDYLPFPFPSDARLYKQASTFTSPQMSVKI